MPSLEDHSSFHILTGEYPPQPGGVADYSAILADALSRRGYGVHIWTSSTLDGDLPFQETPGVEVHRIAGEWSKGDLERLGAALDAFPKPRRLLLQHTPNVWKHRGLNLGFCRWLSTRQAVGDDLRPMFHELWYEFDPRDKPTRWIFPVVQRLMVRAILQASSKGYLSIPAWADKLKPAWIGQKRPLTWLPVPSNIPVVDDPEAVAETRQRLAPNGEIILGSFGTFHGKIGDMLAEALSTLRKRPAIVLMGRRSREFASMIQQRLSNIHATGPLSTHAASVHLSACDLLIQPYPDGISSRRGSAMAGLAHGKAMATTRGYLSESIWEETGAVRLADDPKGLALEVDRLIESVNDRRSLETAATALYRERFDVERVVDRLIGTYS